MMRVGIACVLMVAALSVVANGQYFSQNNGINYPRNGKRSYLSDLVRVKDFVPNKGVRQQQQPLDSRVYSADKLSFRKWHGKYGRRELLEEQQPVVLKLEELEDTVNEPNPNEIAAAAALLDQELAKLRLSNWLDSKNTQPIVLVEENISETV